MPDGPDLRPLSAALDAAHAPADVWSEIRRLWRESVTPGPRWYVAVCRGCGEDFWTERMPDGRKWSSMCTSCLQDEV